VFTARYGLIPYIKLVFINVVGSVYSAVRTDSVYRAGFYKRGKIAYSAVGLSPDIMQVFINVVESVYSAVRTDSLYTAGFYKRGGKCLQRGTD
jgi:hypothetical protein